MNYCTSSGIRLAYQIEGPEQAQSLVMLNSIATNFHMWDAQAEMLSQTYRVIRYDTRGHGNSDVPSGPYTIEQLGNDLLALLDELHIEKVALCGLSLGGVTAQWFTLTYPHRVEKAVFANTAARIGSVDSWNTRIDAVQKGGMAGLIEPTMARFLSQNFREQQPEITARIRSMVLATNPRGYIGACEALRSADLRAHVHEINVPSLVIGADKDESTPVEQAYELHHAIKNSQLIIYNGVAHLSNLERPDEFSHALLHFLQDQ